jgi:hypothetical protein
MYDKYVTNLDLDTYAQNSIQLELTSKSHKIRSIKEIQVEIQGERAVTSRHNGSSFLSTPVPLTPSSMYVYDFLLRAIDGRNERMTNRQTDRRIGGIEDFVTEWNAVRSIEGREREKEFDLDHRTYALACVTYGGRAMDGDRR